MLGNAAASVKNLSSQEGRFFVVGWFFSIVLCAGLDAFALSFTDPGLIAPLSGFTLVLNVWVAQFVNSEEVFAIDYAVTALILVGVIVTILSGPSAAPPLVDAEYLWSHVLRPPFLVYQVVMHSSAFFVSRMAKKVYGDKTESGIAAGRLAHPRLSGVSPLMFPWVGAIYTAHMNVRLRGPFRRGRIRVLDNSECQLPHPGLRRDAAPVPQGPHAADLL